MRGKFRIDFCNIRGLRANFFSVYAHVCHHRPDVFALCETQVSENANPQDFHIPGYHLLSLFNFHRGLVMYIRDEVAFQCQQPLGTYDVEFSCLWVKFKIRKHYLHFGFLYRSPNAGRDLTISTLDALSDSITKILESYPSSEIVVAGDFNVHNSSWLRHSSHTTPEGQYVELFAAHNHLAQIVNEPTHIPCVEGYQNNTLDLFLTSHPNKYEVDVLSPLGNSDHCTISASFSFSNLHTVSRPATKRTRFIYGKARWAELNDFFRQFNWKLCFLDKNVNAMAKMVENVIMLGMKSFIPSKKSSIKPRQKSWFNPTCANAIRSREDAFRIWRNNKNPDTELLRKKARSSCAKVLRRQKTLHEQRLRTEVLSAPRGSKSFWSFVKRVKDNASSSIPTLLKDDQPFTDPVDKANLLAELFASNSCLPESNQPLPALERVSVTMPNIFFRARAVKRVLADLNINKSPGPDGIPALVLKQCCSTLARPLATLFSTLYHAGEFPMCWKVANVTPIPKKGKANNPENYRPIAICSALSKVMESMVNYHLVKYLEFNNLLNDRQYGFRRGRSTGDVLAFLSEKWCRSIHQFGESKVVALDISKAFDRVWHGALISKLIAFGVGKNFSRFISSFLRDRTIRVVIDGISSNEFKINSGVPQGSVLSPSLFLIFLNDLLCQTFNPIYSFADDSNICHSYSFNYRPSLIDIRNMRQNMNDTLNSDLVTISEWGRANRVDFNASKTQCCLLTHKRMTDSVASSVIMGDTNIEESKTLDVLGMKIQCDVRWTEHIFQVSKEALKCLGFLKRCKTYFTPTDLLTIYITYIRPKMEYNSHVWAGASKSILELLDRVQERAKVLIGDSRVANSIDSLEHRRNVGCISLFYRYYNGRCSNEIKDLVPETRIFLRNTRISTRAHSFVVDWPVDRTTHYRENSFFSRTVRLWNKLPAEVFPPNYDVRNFKSNIHKYYSLYPPSHNLFS